MLFPKEPWAVIRGRVIEYRDCESDQDNSWVLHSHRKFCDGIKCESSKIPVFKTVFNPFFFYFDLNIKYSVYLKIKRAYGF